MSSANKLHTKLIAIETDGQNEPDFRRVIRDERFAVEIAINSGDGAKIVAASNEARRVLAMWGIHVASDGRETGSP